MTPREIIGPDDRTRVDSTKPSSWHAVALLEITHSDGSKSIGTGWYAAPRLIVTAGHCVYDTRGWVRSIRVTPACNGEIRPYAPFVVTNFRTTGGWIDSGDLRTDYGALLLPEDLPSQPEPYALLVSDDATLKGSRAHIAGYPTDRTKGTLWEANQMIESADAFELFYEIDTKPGESGAPILQRSGQTMVVVGIHHWGASAQDPYNRGIRLTETVLQNLRRWKDESEHPHIV